MNKRLAETAEAAIYAHRQGYSIGFRDGLAQAAEIIESKGGQTWRKRIAAELRTAAKQTLKTSKQTQETPGQAGSIPDR